jgi:hypothetical protein
VTAPTLINTTCRFCARRIVFDESTKSIDHEYPECPEFLSLLAEFEKKHGPFTERRVRVRNEEGVERPIEAKS